MAKSARKLVHAHAHARDWQDPPNLESSLENSTFLQRMPFWTLPDIDTPAYP